MSPERPAGGVSTVLCDAVAEVVVVRNATVRVVSFRARPMQGDTSFFVISSRGSATHERGRDPYRKDFPDYFNRELSDTSDDTFDTISNDPDVKPVLPGIVP